MEAVAKPAPPAETPSGHLGFAKLPRIPQSAGDARRWAHKLLDWLDEDTLDNVGVMVSELVTNAYLYTTTPEIWVHVAYVAEVLKVEVTDDGSGDWEQTDPEHEGGRGLDIVKLLSDCWGISGQTTVWFELKTAGCQ